MRTWSCYAAAAALLASGAAAGTHAQAVASCQALTDPASDVILLTGADFDDPSRDISYVEAWTSGSTLRFRVHVADLQPVPMLSAGDLFRMQFSLDEKMLIVDASRRILATPTPHNAAYGRIHQVPGAPVSTTWDAGADTLTISFPLASLRNYLKRPVRNNETLHDLVTFTVPAVTDGGTPAWADFAGKPGSNGAGATYRLGSCSQPPRR